MCALPRDAAAAAAAACRNMPQRILSWKRVKTFLYQ